MGDLKLVERLQQYTLAPGASKVIRANIKVGVAGLLGWWVDEANLARADIIVLCRSRISNRSVCQTSTWRKKLGLDKWNVSNRIRASGCVFW
jgi:hypothetical protein